MKKVSVLIFILICLLLFGNLILGANLVDNVGSGVQKVEDTTNKIEDLKNTKWDYLGTEWKTILLKNKIISTIDSSLQKISLVFEILIHEPYLFSLRFFIILFLWLFVFFNLSKLLGESFFEGGISYVAGFIIVIILAYLGSFNSLYLFLVGIVNLFSGGVVYLVILLIFIIFIIIQILIRYFERSLRLDRKKQEKEEEKLNRWSLKKIVETLKKSI